jgi:uncharacterized protein
VEKTRAHVREALSGDASGHDWWHTDRVVRVALRIAREEGADHYVVELAALLHDLADWKFAGGDESAGPRAAREWLESLEADPAVIDHVCEIVAGVSFKGAGVATPMRTVEGMAVQDADRLDALGAIGIARAFAYGGRIGSALHDPDFAPRLHGSFEEYKKGGSPTTAHFHEKLFLLKDRMLTSTGRRLAGERHRFMEQFIDRFEKEWAGEE